MATILDEIVAAHRRAAESDDRDPARLEAACAELAPPRDFLGALRARPEIAVISEIKRRSPSKGDLAPRLDPATLARDYELGGASCLSVLTDVHYFGGSAADLGAARAAVGLPVLRKDFTVSPLDLYDARLMGADAVLLIVAALDDTEITSLLSLGRRLGLAVLVEVHDEAESARALSCGAELVGVNQRDLHTFAVDTARALRVLDSLPDEVVRVAESGISSADDVRALAGAGFDAILVGEALVTAPDPAAALRALRPLDARRRRVSVNEPEQVEA